MGILTDAINSVEEPRSGNILSDAISSIDSATEQSLTSDKSIGQRLLGTAGSTIAGLLEAGSSYLKIPALMGSETAEKGVQMLESGASRLRPEDQLLVDKAMESTAQSLGVAAPIWLGGTVLTGPVAGTVGAIAGKGAVFGVAQYYDFMKEIEKAARSGGATDNEIAVIQKSMRVPGLISAGAEMGGEVLSDALTARIFGLMGNKGISLPIKGAIKRALGNWAVRSGASLPGELLGEEATTAVQYGAAKMAGLEQAPLKEQLGETAKVTAMQTFIQGLVLQGASGFAQRRKNAQIAEQVVEKFGVSKEEAKAAVKKVLQEGPTPSQAEPVKIVDLGDREDEAVKVLQEEHEKAKEAEVPAEERVLRNLTPDKNILKEALKDAESVRVDEGPVSEGRPEQEQGAGESSEDIQLEQEKRKEGVSREVEQPAQQQQQITEADRIKTEASTLGQRFDSDLSMMGKPNWFQVSDPVTKDTYVVREGESVEEKLRDVRKKWNLDMEGKPLTTEKEEPENASEVQDQQEAQNQIQQEIQQDPAAASSTGQGQEQEVVEKTQTFKTKREALSEIVKRKDASLSVQKEGSKWVVKAKALAPASGQTALPSTEQTIESAKQRIIARGEAEGRDMSPSGAKRRVEQRVWTRESEKARDVTGEVNLNFKETSESGELASIEQANKNLVEKDSMFQTLEEASSPSTSEPGPQAGIDRLRSEVNKIYHTGQGSLEPLAKVITDTLNDIEEQGPRVYLKKFESPRDYNKFVDSLNRLAEYIVRVARALNDRLGQSGQVAIPRGLVNTVQKWKEKRTFHKNKEIKYRVDGAETDTIQNKISEDLNPITKAMFHSYLPTSKVFPEEARSLVYDFIRAELWKNYNIGQEQEFIRRLRQPLSSDQIKAVTELGFHIEDYHRKAKSQLKTWKVKNPEAVIEAQIDEYLETFSDRKVVETYKTIRREFFDKFKELYKAHLIKSERHGVPQSMLDALDQFMAGRDMREALSANGLSKASDLKRFTAFFKSYMGEIREIRSWGTEDYWTHMMIGNLVVRETTLDEKGKSHTSIITVGNSVKNAIEKAQAYIEAQRADGKSVGEISIDDGFSYDGDVPAVMLSRKQFFTARGRLDRALKEAEKVLQGVKLGRSAGDILKGVVGIKPSEVFAAPTLETKNVLPGENDIFVAMEAYSRVMWKKLSYDPVIWDMKSQLPNFEPGVREHLESVLKWSKGSFSPVDKLMDGLFALAGMETNRSFSRFVVRPMTSGVATSKLMYRPVAALLNWVDGESKTWIQLREKYWWAGLRALRTPEGKALVEKYGWSLGARFESDEGHLKTGMKLWNHTVKGWKTMFMPMGLFQLPELPVREHNFMSAYMYYKDTSSQTDKKLLEEEAIEFAQRSVYLLQSSNTIAGRPELMRTPEGRLFSIFVPYVVRQIEFVGTNANSPGFWARYIPYMLGMAGPRGLMAFVRSVPFLEWILAAFGIHAIWDKIELWMQKNIPGSGGVASFAGRDIVAPATVQLPTNGIASINLIRDVWNGFIEPVVTNSSSKWYQTEEGMKQVFPFLRNWGDVWDSLVDKDGFVLDEENRPKYNMNSEWDRSNVFLGIKSESKSASDLVHRIGVAEERLERKKAEEVARFFRGEVQTLFRRGWTKTDELPAGVLEKCKQDILKYHLSPNILENAMDGIRSSQEIRDLFRMKVLNRADQYERGKGVVSYY